MRWEQILPGGDGLTAFEASLPRAPEFSWFEDELAAAVPRDYNGMRGPVPTRFRAHDWQTCRVMREAGDVWWARVGRAAVAALADERLRHRGRR